MHSLKHVGRCQPKNLVKDLRHKASLGFLPSPASPSQPPPCWWVPPGGSLLGSSPIPTLPCGFPGQTVLICTLVPPRPTCQAPHQLAGPLCSCRQSV